MTKGERERRQRTIEEDTYAGRGVERKTFSNNGARDKTKDKEWESDVDESITDKSRDDQRSITDEKNLRLGCRHRPPPYNTIKAVSWHPDMVTHSS